jgi:predicted aconitase with swiveling domain
MAVILKGKFLVAGYGSGNTLTTRQSISFWGGVDPATGLIVDPRHELFEKSIKEKILAFPYGKGSAAAPLVILEMVKQGTAPAAIINVETDPLLVAGPIISKHFYHKIIPVVSLNKDDFQLLKSGMHAVVDGEKDEVILSG